MVCDGLGCPIRLYTVLVIVFSASCDKRGRSEVSRSQTARVEAHCHHCQQSPRVSVGPCLTIERIRSRCCMGVACDTAFIKLVSTKVQANLHFIAIQQTPELWIRM